MARPDTTDSTNRNTVHNDDNNMLLRLNLCNATIKDIRALNESPKDPQRQMMIIKERLEWLQNADGGRETARFENDLRRINQGLNPGKETETGKHILPLLMIDGVDSKGPLVINKVTGNRENLIQENGVLGPAAMRDTDNAGKLYLASSLEDSAPWKRSITPDNVTQGMLGDCYFISALESLARKNPEAIKEMIVDNGPGADGKHSYTVTFPGRADTPVKVSEPNEYETTVFAQDQAGLWVNILEKAHRQLNGKSMHDEGDTGYNGMKYLTSNTPTVLSLRLHAEEAEDTLKMANEKNIIMTCTTVTPDSLRDKNGNLVEVAKNHLFEVVSYDEQNGTVTLANPWGTNYLDTKNAPNDTLVEDPDNKYVPNKFDQTMQRIFNAKTEPQTGRYMTMSLDDFKSRFACITYSEIDN